jgi:hypothetical protein
MSSSTVAMQRETVLENHPEVAKSHLRLYDWVKTHATLQAVFHPGPHQKGQSVEIYVTPKAPGRAPGLTLIRARESLRHTARRRPRTAQGFDLGYRSVEGRAGIWSGLSVMTPSTPSV